MNVFEEFAAINKLIETNLTEIKRLRALACDVPTADPSKEFVSHSFNTESKFSSIINKVIDLENELTEEIDEYLVREKELYDALKKIKPIYSLVLRYYYIENMTVEEIAEKLECSVRYVYNLKSRALSEVAHFIS